MTTQRYGSSVVADDDEAMRSAREEVASGLERQFRHETALQLVGPEEVSSFQLCLSFRAVRHVISGDAECEVFVFV